MTDTIQEKICATVADVLEIDATTVTLEHHFINDLGANSLDVVEFVMRLEEIFDIQIPDEAADDVQTVGDLMRYVADMLGESEDGAAPTPCQVSIGSDHAGYALKGELIEWLIAQQYAVTDLGTEDENSTDYPEFAAKVATSVATAECGFGVLICGTGIGMSISANKVPGVRAALVHNSYESALARQHNDANVVCFGARVIGPGQAIAALEAFLSTAFEPGDDGRHQRRVDLIGALEVTFSA